MKTATGSDSSSISVTIISMDPRLQEVIGCSSSNVRLSTTRSRVKLQAVINLDEYPRHDNHN